MTKETFGLTVTRTIEAPIENVWKALTTPDVIKQYFFGVDTITDWQVGSPIIYRGTWEGKVFEDKGTILECESPHRLVLTYWSSFSGKPDEPENYQKVSYDLESVEEGTKLTVTQQGMPTEEAREHSRANWESVLGELKQLLEA